jgi:hypothetical protein
MSAITCKTIFVSIIAITCLAACGGKGASDKIATSQSTPVASALPANVATITVDAGPAYTVDAPFVSVTVCPPGDSVHCQIIDHILVDSGSSGLRIMGSVLSTSMLLPAQTDASGNTIVECTEFADGFSWGPVKFVDLAIAGEQATDIAMQVIDDSTLGAYSIPDSCSSQGAPEDDVQSFGANGVLGIGPFVQDCGDYCASSPAQPAGYYACGIGDCQPTSIALSAQVVNPVAFFSSDNNGVVIALPSISAAGAASVSGSLIFGIGTQENNGLGNASVLPINPSTGLFMTTYKGVLYPNSFIDSGSNALYFNDRTITVCTQASSTPGYFCPASALNLSADNSVYEGANGVVSFTVANANSLVVANLSFTAFLNIAAPNTDPESFDWGLPFFFGRNVYTAIEGKNTVGGVGPYFAY